jgi:guanine deaminase
VTLYRATVFDTPGDGLPGVTLRAQSDAGLRVLDGTIVARAEFAVLAAAHADDEVVDLREGILLPGLVDTHVHFPQVRVIGGLGLPLLERLDQRALP